MINVDDVQVGVKELERCRKLGFVGAMITVYPPRTGNMIRRNTIPSGPQRKT